MLRIYELIASKEAHASRQFIYSELISAPDAVTPAEQEKIEEVAVTLDRVGALVGAGLVPKDLLFKSHREMIIRSWDKLAPYVFYRRLQRDSTFAIHFEQLADSARGNREVGSIGVLAEPETQHDTEAAKGPDPSAPATQA